MRDFENDEPIIGRMTMFYVGKAHTKVLKVEAEAIKHAHLNAGNDQALDHLRPGR
ncbi:MAG: hypothetical protein JWN94_3257 [Betaproteobacteria bacterium]|nr:hypothetical protein [Betaproteobacteria bacterium]